MTEEPMERSKDPFAHIPEGRFTWTKPGSELPPGPTIDAPRLLRMLNRSAIATMVLLGVAAAAAAWAAFCFASRGPDDIEVTTDPDVIGITPLFDGNTYWSTDFLIRAQAPFVVAFVCCGAALVWWHITIDRAARDLDLKPETAPWQARWGWFIPFGNLVYPFRSLRELTRVYQARVAERLFVPWWALWLLTFVLGGWVFYSTPGEGIDMYGDSAQHLDTAENVLVAVGALNMIDAVLALLVVRSLTTAVRERLTSCSQQ